MRSVIANSPSAILFGVSGHNKAVFFRQLATMVQAGLPVGKAVVTAGQHSLEALTAELALLIERHGKTLSEAMAQYPYHFNRHEVALVKAGETSGQMDRQLNELAHTAELNWQLHKKITSKLVYPALVAHSAVLLPPLFLLVKDGLAAYLTTVLGMLIPAYILFGLFFFFYRYSRLSGGVRRLTDHFVASVPMLGGPHQYGARIRFFQTMANLTEAGFLPSQAIPLAADSADSLKRNRGRRGLDILQKIQKNSEINVQLVETDYPTVREVDMKLIELAKELNAKIVTNDFNLNKVAELQGVTVLNINELANSVRPNFIAGEQVEIRITREGKESNQGVGYLDDGTMVVVEGARDFIGKTVEAVVTQTLQTSAGRMIFTRRVGYDGNPTEGHHYSDITGRSSRNQSENMRPHSSSWKWKSHGRSSY